jgi:HEAT repeat protein
VTTPRNLPEDLRRQILTAYHDGADAAQFNDWLQDADPRTRALAVRAAMHQGVLSASRALTIATDAEPMVRRELWHGAASTWLDIDATPALCDSDPLVREAAVCAIGEQAQTRYRARVEQLAQHDDDARVREAAVVTLGQIADPASIPVLVTILNNDKAPVRRRVVVALSAFDDPRVEAALDEANDDRDWQTRDAVTRLRRDEF